MRLYVCVRGDLDVGPVVAQSCHAAIDFGFAHPHVHTDWHQKSNTIVCLAVENEEKLLELEAACHRDGIEHVLVREPDYGNVATAIAIAPSGSHLTKYLRLVS